MKKKRIASLLLLAPLALFAACSTTPKLGLEANWFNQVSTKTIPDDFKETLEYKVTFEQSTSSRNGNFSMDYPNGGTYTTTFEGGSKDGKKIYVYSTTLTMQVQYTLNGEKSKLLDDVVTTRVEFMDVANELKPISSSRVVHATAPASTSSSPATTLSAAYKKLDYKTEITYNHEKQRASFNLTYLTAEDEIDTAKSKNNIENREIKIKCKGTFFDNEQLIPALRAAELSSSMALYTIDSQECSLDKLSVKDGPTAVTVKQSVKLKTDEAATEHEFEAYEIGLAYNKQNSGGTQTFTIAKRKAPDSNTNRNVLLKYKYPVIYSHGTLTYSLIAANFYD